MLFTYLITSVCPKGKSASFPDTTKPVQSFQLADANGNKADVATLRGKVVFINFWALTCAPCKAEMPTINNLSNHYSGRTDFRVLPVDLDHNFSGDIDYYRKNGFTLPVFAPAGVVPPSLFMGELPTTAVLTKTGRMALLRQGEGKYDTPSFYSFIDSLLKQ